MKKLIFVTAILAIFSNSIIADEEFEQFKKELMGEIESIKTEEDLEQFNKQFSEAIREGLGDSKDDSEVSDSMVSISEKEADNMKALLDRWHETISITSKSSPIVIDKIIIDRGICEWDNELRSISGNVQKFFYSCPNGFPTEIKVKLTDGTENTFDFK